MSRAGSGFPPGGLRMPPGVVTYSMEGARSDAVAAGGRGVGAARGERWRREPYRRGAAGWIGGQDMPVQGIGDEQVITGPGHAVAEDEVRQVAYRLGAGRDAETDEPPSLTPHRAGHDQCAGAVAADGGRVRELGQHLLCAVAAPRARPVPRT